MAAKNDRIGIRREHLADSGLTLSCDDIEVQALNDWFAREVDIDATNGAGPAFRGPANTNKQKYLAGICALATRG